jgi:hypothetical protein
MNMEELKKEDRLGSKRTSHARSEVGLEETWPISEPESPVRFVTDQNGLQSDWPR